MLANWKYLALCGSSVGIALAMNACAGLVIALMGYLAITLGLFIGGVFWLAVADNKYTYKFWITLWMGVDLALLLVMLVGTNHAAIDILLLAIPILLYYGLKEDEKLYSTIKDDRI